MSDVHLSTKPRSLLITEYNRVPRINFDVTLQFALQCRPGIKLNPCTSVQHCVPHKKRTTSLVNSVFVVIQRTESPTLNIISRHWLATMSDLPVLIIGAGVSGLLLAQHLKKQGIPFRIFERDTSLVTRGVGWGLTLHWSLAALRSLLPEELVQRLPYAYADRLAVEKGVETKAPYFDLSTGDTIAITPSKPHKVRVTRQRLRVLLSTDLNIEVSEPLSRRN